MNSDKAAAVRDAINGCPTVVDDDDLVERNGEPRKSHRGSTERILTGDRIDPSRSYFRPAYIDQSGTLGNGDGAERPVFVVVLESLWTETDDVRSLSPEMVYEVAKHDCRVRFYPPDHRLDGDIWITDHFEQHPTDTNGDRCPECNSTYFKLRDGEPECARCGATEETAQTTLMEASR
jgi:hypothetical protein